MDQTTSIIIAVVLLLLLLGGYYYYYYANAPKPCGPGENGNSGCILLPIRTAKAQPNNNAAPMIPSQDPIPVANANPIPIANANPFQNEGATVIFRGGKDGKLCTDDTSGMQCNRDAVGPWEKFIVKPCSANKVAFKGGRSGKFCSDDGPVKCNADTPGQSECFTYNLGAEGKTFTLSGGKNNKFCADEGGQLVCNRDVASTWEQFTFV